MWLHAFYDHTADLFIFSQCRDYFCCGLDLIDLHALWEHRERMHSFSQYRSLLENPDATLNQRTPVHHPSRFPMLVMPEHYGPFDCTDLHPPWEHHEEIRVVSMDHSPSQNPDIPHAQRSATHHSQTSSRTECPLPALPEQHGTFYLGVLDPLDSQVFEPDHFEAQRSKTPLAPNPPCLLYPNGVASSLLISSHPIKILPHHQVF
jgi:hypothetical protein